MSGESDRSGETQSGTSGPLRISAMEGGIDVGDVVINGNHVLFPFEIENVRRSDCYVRFESSLDNEITFQFGSNYLSDFEGPDDYNELFNLVEKGNETQVEGLSKTIVTLQFRPDSSRIPVKSHQISRDGDDESRSRHHFIEIQGSIFVHVLNHECKYEIPFHARICRSELRVDVEDLVFEDCYIGGTFVRDFTVWNTSQIPLSFSVVLPGADHFGCGLSFKSFETGLSISNAVVQAYAPMKIRVTFQPKKTGEHLIPVHIANKHDERNSFTFKIYSHVLETAQKDMVSIGCESIDFGDCYTETSYQQVFMIQNLSRDILDVKLVSNIGDEVKFDWHTDVETKSKAKRLTPTEAENTTDDTTTAPTEKMELSQSVGPNAHMEELTLYPGMERLVKVWFTPQRDLNLPDSKATRLSRRHFRLDVRCSCSKGAGKELVFVRSISARARLCTSLVKVSATDINLGPCIIGEVKVGSIQISNLSDLPANISLELDSKILSCIGEPKIYIPPKGQYTLKISCTPRKVNKDYKKSMILLNSYNKSNEVTITVRSRNVERMDALHHSQFFSASTESINFGRVVVSSSSLRCFEVKNTTFEPISLRFSSSDEDDLRLYRESRPQAESHIPTSGKKKELLLETILDSRSRLEASKGGTLFPFMNPEKSPQTANKYLDLATSQTQTTYGNRLSVRGKQSEVLKRTNSASRFSEKDLLEINTSDQGSGDSYHAFLQGLVKHFEESISIISISTEKEDSFARTEINARKNLSNAIESGILSSFTQLDLLPLSSCIIYVVYTPYHRFGNMKGKLRKVEEKIKISYHLTDESQGALQSTCATLEIPVHIKICRSIMDVTQKNINFGSLAVHESRQKNLTIINLSEVPLIYRIKKSGSIMSECIQFVSNQIGVCRPYETKEVPFIFQPVFEGKFQEAFFVQNMLDSSNDKLITIKAQLMKPKVFSVQSDEVDFGDCVLGDLSAPKKITISNNSKRKRLFEISPVFDDQRFSEIAQYLKFEVEKGSATGSLSIDIEEELEKLMKKKRIYERKGKKEKLKELNQKIELLKQGIIPTSNMDEGSSSTSEVSEDEGVKADQISVQPKAKSLTLVVEIESGQSVTVSISLHARVAENYVAQFGLNIFREPLMIEGKISINEHKNLDFVKDVCYKARMFADRHGLMEERRSTHRDAESWSHGYAASHKSAIKTFEVAPSILLESGQPMYHLKLQGDDRITVHFKEANEPSKIVFPSGLESSRLPIKKQLSITSAHNQDIVLELKWANLTALGDQPEPEMTVYGELNVRPNPSDLCIINQNHENTRPAKDNRSAHILLRAHAAIMISVELRIIYNPGKPKQGGTENSPVTTEKPKHMISGASPLLDIFGSISIAPLSLPTAVHTINIQTQVRSQISAILPSKIDIGDVLASEPIISNFTLYNYSSGYVTFVIAAGSSTSQKTFDFNRKVTGVLSFTPSMCRIPPSGSTSIRVECRPYQPGKQTHVAVVKNLESFHEEMLSISFNPRFVQFLDMKGDQKQIDFGQCYITDGPTVSTFTREICIQNIANVDIDLSCSSNIPKQLSVYRDVECRVLADNLKLHRLQVHKLYIQLRPHLDHDLIKSREIIGGIRFKVNEVEIDHILRVMAVVGKSILAVSPDVIDLGSLQQTGDYQHIRGSFLISNKSSTHSSDYKIAHSSNMTIEPRYGVLQGTNAGSLAEKRIDFTFSVKENGIYSERIEITNNKNTKQNLVVYIRALVQENLVQMSGAPSNSKDIVFKEIYLHQKPTETSGPEKSSPALFLAADTFQTMILQNRSKDTLTLVPYSCIKLNVQVDKIQRDPAKRRSLLARRFEYDGDDDADQVGGRRASDTTPSSDTHTYFHDQSGATETIFSKCGKEFTLGANESAVLKVYPPSSNTIPESRISDVLQGKLFPFSGILAFEHIIASTPHQNNRRDLRRPRRSHSTNQNPTTVTSYWNRVIMQIPIKGSFCVSSGEVANSIIDVGKFGCLNTWRDINFEVEIRNKGHCKLRYMIDANTLPPELSLCGDQVLLSGELMPDTKSILPFVLRTGKIARTETGAYSTTVEVQNKDNPNNKMTFTVKGSIIGELIKFKNLDERGRVRLNTIIHPKPQPQSNATDVHLSTGTFSIENTLDEAITLRPIFRSEAEVEGIITTFVSGEGSADMREDVTLQPHETMDIHVQARVNDDIWMIPESIVPKHSISAFVTLGQISLESSSVIDLQALPSVSVCCFLQHGPTFAVSKASLAVEAPSSGSLDVASPATFHILNENQDRALEFEVKYTLPKETRDIDIEIAPCCGTVLPGSSQEVEVFAKMTKANQGKLPSLTIDVYDINNPAIPLHIPVSLQQVRTPTQPPVQASSSNAESGTLFTSQILLQGCAKVPGSESRYEINLGQINYGSGSSTWALTIENTSGEAVNYQIFSTHPDSEKWMTITPTAGVLGPRLSTADKRDMGLAIDSASSSQEIMLSISTDILDVFTCYVIIQNNSNPADFKSIRVSVEVVRKQRAKTDAYTILIDDARPDLRHIDMGNVCHDHLYHDRFFRIATSSEKPLDLLVAAHIEEQDPSELHFSLSHSSPKLFNSIRVQCDSPTKVYLYFIPRFPTEAEKRFDYSVKFEITISVKSRVIKDSQLQFKVIGTLHWPQLQMSSRSVFFSVPKNIRVPNPATPIGFDCDPESEEIVIRNAFVAPLRLVIKNESSFVTLTQSGSETVDSPEDNFILSIRPDREAILKHSPAFSKDFYIEDHFTVYNRGRPWEKCRVSVRLSSGYLHKFYAPPGFTNTYSLNRLEEHIVRFLRSFHAMWTDVTQQRATSTPTALLSPSPSTSISPSSSASGLSALADGGILQKVQFGLVDDILVSKEVGVMLVHLVDAVLLLLLFWVIVRINSSRDALTTELSNSVPSFARLCMIRVFLNVP
eukprot:TRINITY_DN3914_c0_g1_i4.p1 TRINITY_DN3914_c0_g1~~TRINITY_DN3914_c0_g1_i4.p1  ORF type:complete len:2911 (-),score=486.97 TRINITY_DN3914_c0_g1_i4:749-9481(-)